MRKLAFCLCNNKGTEELSSKSTADLHIFVLSTKIVNTFSC